MMAAKPKKMARCWDIADKNIARYKNSIDKALRGEGTANVATCREMIDRWLEYRYEHKSSDLAAL
jgi:Holliday junction resolvasome RuvABC endonuclease subunit